jgi:hypothetical protein
MIYQDNVEGLAVWLPWDAGETEILAIRDASPVMRQILAELSRQLLVATTYHQGPRAADQPDAGVDRCKHGVWLADHCYECAKGWTADQQGVRDDG